MNSINLYGKESLLIISTETAAYNKSIIITLDRESFQL